MDFFQRVRNTFQGAGWVSDEEKKKKQQQAAQPKPQPVQQPKPQIQKVNQLFGQKSPVVDTLTVDKPKPIPLVNKVVAPPKVTAPPPNLGDVANGAVNVVKNVASGIPKLVQDVVKDPVKEIKDVAQTPFRAAASIAKAAGDKTDYQSNGLRRFFFGDKPIESVTQQGQDLADLSQNKGDIQAGKHTQVNPALLGILGLVSAAGDATPLGAGKKRILKKAADEAKNTAKDVAKETAQAGTKKAIEAEKSAVDAAKKAPRSEFTDKIMRGEDQTVTLNDPKEKIATTYRGAEPSDTVETIAKKNADNEAALQQKVETINADPRLNEADKARFVQVEQGQVAKAADDLTKQLDVAQSEQKAVTEEVANNRATAIAPEKGDAVAPTPDPESAANNAYDTSGRPMNDFLDEQTRRQQEAKENPIKRLFRIAKEQVYDPLTTFEKYDPKGAVGDESIVNLMRRVTSPEQAVEVRLKAPIRLPDGTQGSLWDVIQKYGKEDGAKAQDFANYRMFKDELWRMTEGGQEPALRADPQEMSQYVARYEAEHPDAIPDNALLREFALRNLKERADSGIDSQDIYEASAKNPYYTPRTRALARNKDLAMTHTGGFTTTSRSTASRSGADVAIAPLDLFRLDARNTEMGVLKNKLGENFYNRAEAGDAGFRTDIDPNTAVAHRDARVTFDSARQDLADLRETRDSLKGEKVLTANEFKAVQAKAKAAEEGAITKMRDALSKAANTPEDVLHDVAARDPQFDAEAAAIKARYGKDRVITTPQGTTLTPKEKTAQMKQELADLNTKYPDPAVNTKKELLELAQSLDSGQYTAAELAEQAVNLRQQIPDLEQRLETLKGATAQARSDVSEGKDAASQAWSDLQDTTQHREDFNGNVWTFKVDGEIGRGTAPAELAAEMSRLLEAAKPGSKANLLLRATQTVGSATKALWTGAFAPVWRTLQVAQNFGLMLHNGHWLDALTPTAVQGFVEGLVPIRQETRDFIDGLKARGASYENLTQSAAMRNMVADDIAARANIGTFLARNPINTLKDFYHATGAVFTHIANAQRNSIAYTAYKRATDAGIPNDKAMHMAVEEITNVFGDLQRVSELAQALEPLIPYSGATQAGVRALVNKAKRNPAEFAVKQAAIVSGVTAFTLYSMQNSEEYYDDQIQKGYTNDLDTHIVIVLPGAKQDAAGNWSGIVKIPLTPDFRDLNKATWRSVYSLTKGQGVNVGMVAGQLFNQFTGDIVPNTYNANTAEQAGGNPLMGLFTGSPALNTGKIVAGVNPTTGQPLSDSDMSLQPRSQQAYGTTSNAARDISEGTNGALTPIQLDKLFGQFGNTGKAIKKSDEPNGNPLSTFFDFTGALTGSKGTTAKQDDTKQYFDNLNTVEKSIDPNDRATLKAFQALHSKQTGEEKDNLLNSATKANQFMQYQGDGTFKTTPLFNAEKQLDDIQRQQGKPGNPMFDLPEQALQKVLMYRSLKAANAAGQNYSKGGESAFTSLGLDEKWYQDYRDAESNYYKQLGLQGSSEQKSFSGKPTPSLSDEQRNLQSQYFALPAKSDARRAFLASNPWMKDYWAADNDFTDQERKALGFDSLNGDNAYDGKTAGSGSGSSYNAADHVNTLTGLTNFSDGIKDYTAPTDKKEQVPELTRLFQALVAQRSSSRAKPHIGASSSGR